MAPYGLVATRQPDPHVGPVLASYSGMFVDGSLAWRVVVDWCLPDRRDRIGAGIVQLGVAVIISSSRGD